MYCTPTGHLYILFTVAGLTGVRRLLGAVTQILNVHVGIWDHLLVRLRWVFQAFRFVAVVVSHRMEQRFLVFRESQYDIDTVHAASSARAGSFGHVVAVKATIVHYSHIIH